MQKFEVTINYDLCIVCEGCIETCGENVFEFDEEDQRVVVKNSERCTGGMECIEQCSPQAITVKKII